jgi:DNA helicase-2/ATP-dependent DNA helicase PcrA
MDNKLNSAQKQAVEHVSGPLIIVAGAGTGKTTVVTQKIKYLLDNKLAAPEEILALTFNEKAAAEMQSRVDEMMETGYLEMHIATFHAFCEKLIRQFGLDIGLPNKFNILTDTDAWLLIRKNLDRFNLNYYRPLGNPTRHIHELIKHFHKCKDEMISPEEYSAHALTVVLDKDISGDEERGRLSEVANAFHEYNRLLLENNYLDFADLIFWTNKLLDTRPSILKKIQNQFKFVLVDEFQDVNFAQYTLVKKLSAKAQLTVVGDDDQSIYAFRGASVSNILRFKEDFPDTREIILTENYRSAQEILDKSYALIQNNNPDRLEAKLKINKKLLAKNDLPDKKQRVVHSHLRTIDEEAKFVAEEIIKIKKQDKSATWDDFTILTRANSHVEPFMNELQRNGVPYEFLAAAGLYRERIVLDALNFFKTIDNYRESAAIYRLLKLPMSAISENDLQKITLFAKMKSISYYEALKRAAEIYLSDSAQTSAQKILAAIHSGMKNARNEKPTQTLYKFLDESEYLKYLARGEEKGDRDIIRDIHHLNQFFEYVKNYESMTADANVKDFLAHFTDVLESGDSGIIKQPEDTPDSVNIMTVHMSKGLEYKYVFIVNLVEERFPLRRHGDDAIQIPLELIKEHLPEGDVHYQEERRLMYVAMTRAKERLYLTSAEDYGGSRDKKLSRFLGEIGFNVTAKSEKEKKSKVVSLAETPSKGEIVYQIPEKFSFSQIQTYEACPYKYKLKTILAIPTEGSPSLTFGSVMHNVLHKFYSRVQELNSAEQTTLFGLTNSPKTDGGVKAPAMDELLQIYKDYWIADWYKSAKQREEYYDKGIEILRNFYKSNENQWTVPIALEKGFKIKIGGHLITGKIDRVDVGTGGLLEIFDYKTGKPKDKLATEDKEQLLVYQIAVSGLSEYNSFGKVEKLTYIYLTDQSKQSFIGADKDIQKLENKLTEIFARITTRDFEATPEKHTCDFCEYRDICDHRA